VSDQLFVPADFTVSDGLTTGEFRLEPLGPQHNTADYAAWTASIGHIRATPGFAGASWPHQMSPAENLRDLERHAQDFIARRGFTYTVLSTATGEVIGCVYIYPPRVAIQQASACYCWLRGSCGSLFQAAGGRSWWHGGVLCPMSLACRRRRSLPSCRMACWLSGWRRRTG
jgi:hypothetical protein